MPDIRIISNNKQETEHIITALKFFPCYSTCRIHLHYVIWEECNVRANKLLSMHPVADLGNICLHEFDAKDTIVFSCLSVFRAYSSTKELLSPTLCVHPDYALLETNQPSTIPYNHICVLNGDSILESLPHDDVTRVYADIIHYSRQKDPEELLVTSNHNLLLALISIDKPNWVVSHPSINAVNLTLELWENPISHIYSSIAQIQKQMLDETNRPKDAYDLIGIRKAWSSDKHSYSFFASHYDEYMAHVVYDHWINKITAWQKQYTDIPIRRVLELACGTANVSNRLVYRGYEVDACDLSAEMLQVADRKPLKPNLYLASLTDPIPGKDYDLILCMFDSVNYLLKSTEISRMLEQVHLALAVKGLFIFDISTLFNSEENFDDVCSLNHHKEGYLVHQAWFDSIKSRQNSALTSFKQDFIGYSYQYELHKQRVYMCSDLIALIHKSPLKLKAIHNSENRTNHYPHHMHGIDDKYSRLFFILKKD